MMPALTQWITKLGYLQSFLFLRNFFLLDLFWFGFFFFTALIRNLILWCFLLLIPVESWCCELKGGYKSGGSGHFFVA